MYNTPMILKKDNPYGTFLILGGCSWLYGWSAWVELTPPMYFSQHFHASQNWAKIGLVIHHELFLTLEDSPDSRDKD